MKRIKLTLIGLLALATVASAQTIVSENSVVNFEIGNMKVRTVSGTFSGMEGELKFDKNDLANSYFKVCIDASSVDTDNEKRDDHLRNEDFFHVTRYPEICFNSTSISKTNDGFVTKGIMEMHGVKKSVEIPFTFKDNTFIGHITVNRFDYNVGTDVSTTMVSSEAKLEIKCVVK